MSAEFDSVIVRLSGEIWIKERWTRQWYLRHLTKNMKAALKYYGVAYDEMIRKDGRVFLRTHEAVEVAERLSNVFGVSSISPALETEIELDVMATSCLSLAEKVLSKGNSFAVRCRRVGEHPYTSQKVCGIVGRRLLEEFADRQVRVDLDDPDVTFGVEVRDKLGFVFADVIRGVGGFPLGVQGRVIGLLSGGLDSAVACWLVMKRGCPVVPLYFDNEPYTNETTTERAVEVARALSNWAISFPSRLYIVKYGESLKEIVEKAPRRLTCILCKRLMYRVAESIADRVGAEGLVTGDAIGEQASQTIRNLRVLDMAAEKYPVHRPLLGFDKAETERLARRIETYRISARTVKGCTAAPHKPTTKAKLGEIEKTEHELNVQEMVERSLRSLEVVKLEELR